MNKPLPCVVCGMQPEPVFKNNKADSTPYQPSGATMFDAGSGHYGSGVWDTMTSGKSLMINVCDECLVAHKDRVAVVVTLPQPTKVEFGPWVIDA